MSNHKSATTKLSQRDLDKYYTPDFATRELLKFVGISGQILEPCVGKGAISDVLLAPPFPAGQVTTNDLDPQVKAHYHLDVTKRESWEEICNKSLPLSNRFSWTVTNPPFNVASQIIPLAFEYSYTGIAMLLRNSYTEPTFDRQDWLKEHEDHLAHIIFLPRISYTGNGKTDSVSTNWYVWTTEKVRKCELHWVLKSKRSRIAKS